MKANRGGEMRLVLTDDFDTVKSKYIDVIENTPKIHRHAHWEYGKHPSDELLKFYIDRGEMYFLSEGENIAGMTVISMCQGDDYRNISWQEDLKNDEVATLHLLAVCPAYRGKSLGITILEKAIDIAVRNGKKALRLDALKTNLPARRMFERAGFSYRGERRAYADHTGFLDFVYYEKNGIINICVSEQ